MIILCFRLEGVFFFYVVQYIPVSYGENYEYPWWAEAIGIIISLSSMLWIPGYAVYYVMSTPGTWKEVLVKGITPVCTPRIGAPPLPQAKGAKEKGFENL